MMYLTALAISMAPIQPDHLQCERPQEVVNILAQLSTVDEFYCEYALEDAIQSKVCKPAKYGLPRNVCKILKALQLPKVDA